MIWINAIWVFLFLKQIRIYHLNLHETLSKTVVLISQIRKTFKNIFDRFQKVTLPIFAMIYSTTKLPVCVSNVETKLLWNVGIITYRSHKRNRWIIIGQLAFCEKWNQKILDTEYFNNKKSGKIDWTLQNLTSLDVFKESCLLFNLVGLNSFFWLSGIAGQFCFICFGRAFVVIFKAKVDVTCNFLGSISSLVEWERFEGES